MIRNPLFDIDFYKVDHRRQYPEGTTEVYSNFTPRNINNFTSPHFRNEVLVFGIQYFIKDYLIRCWNEGFFNRDANAVIGEYKELIENALGIESFDCSHLFALHALGYLPIHIKAIGEGLSIPLGFPVLTIVNTLPEFFWLTNYLETVISNTLWKPITLATIAFELRKILDYFGEKTGAFYSDIDFQAHDFSSRGMSGREDASISGAAHLISFKGTDCVSAIDWINTYYPNEKEARYDLGFSIPATEHSVMCANGPEKELETFERIIIEVYPKGMVSLVVDSYDYWGFVEKSLPKLKEIIQAREGKVVIRPDSGNPFDIICGFDDCLQDGTAEAKGSLRLLWEIFGGTVNEKGYKVLNPKIGLIYGDSITLRKARLILQRMEEMKFCSTNIVFGIGSFTYQYVTRDTFGFAMKATSIVVNGQRKSIFKEPKTGKNKTSAKGLLRVDISGNKFVLRQDISEEEEKETNSLSTVFKDGISYSEIQFSTVRLFVFIQKFLQKRFISFMDFEK